MDQLTQVYLLSLTIGFAALVGVLRWQSIEPAHQPIVLVWVCIVINETLRFLLLKNAIYTHTSYNVFLLPVVWLYLYQFKEWHLFSGKLVKWWWVGACMSFIWMVDHFVLNGYRLTERTFVYRLCFSLMMVILSVNMINRQIVSEKKSLLRNHRFIICTTLVIYYTFRTLVDTFNLQGMSSAFLSKLGDLNRYLVQIMNFMFLLAALWIPKRKNYILPS